MKTRVIEITPELKFGGDNPPLFIAGPCVIESREHALAMARTLRKLRDELKTKSFQVVVRHATSSIESFEGGAGEVLRF